jgi:hypothetical protein
MGENHQVIVQRKKEKEKSNKLTNIKASIVLTRKRFSSFFKVWYD